MITPYTIDAMKEFLMSLFSRSNAHHWIIFGLFSIMAISFGVEGRFDVMSMVIVSLFFKLETIVTESENNLLLSFYERTMALARERNEKTEECDPREISGDEGQGESSREQLPPEISENKENA